MTLRVTHTLVCDGCGAEIPPEVVLPVKLVDEEQREVHFCDHHCLVPYAERRHTERLPVLRALLVENVAQARANLDDAEANAASSRRLHGLAQEGFDEQIAAAASPDEVDELRAQKAEHAMAVPDLDPVWVAHADERREVLSAAEAALVAHDAKYGVG